MELMEKVAYLKGLIDGLDIDTSTKEGKVLAAIVDVLTEMNDVIYDISDEVTETVEVVDALSEDLGDLEDDFYECCCDDDECDCEECDDEAFEGYEDDEPMYECICPTCGDSICLGESIVEEGSIDCPNCGEKLEFDFDDIVETPDEDE